MVTSITKEAWITFFETYRELQGLWKVKSDDYRNKMKKHKAWNVLLEVYKEIEPTATLTDMKSKVNNIRTCYRRELRKIEESTRSGADEENIHVPTLWYFNHVDFLRDQEKEDEQVYAMKFDKGVDPLTLIPRSKRRKKRRKMDLANAFKNDSSNPNQTEFEGPGSKKDFLRHSSEQLQGLPGNDSSDSQDEDTYSKPYSLQNYPKRKLNGTETMVSRREPKPQDEADVYAKSWACSYRKLSEEQKLYARKAIEEILILGQLNRLTFNSVACPSSSADAEAEECSAYSEDPIVKQDPHIL